jgi:hypothetical protein
MVYCSNCGSELDEGAKYCSDCGEPVEATASTESDSENSTATSPSVTGAEPTDMPEDEENGIQWKRVGMAGLFALIPAFIAYMALSIATGGDTVGIAFVVALPLFGYLLYQRPTAKAMTGGMCYYLAIEFLLSPFVFLLYTVAFASENTSTAAEEAGAAIGGIALTVGAFVIGLPLAIALYLVSRKLESSNGG